MQPLKGIAIALLAGSAMFAQQQNNAQNDPQNNQQANPQNNPQNNPNTNKPPTGDPGVQSDRPSAQTPSTGGKTSMASSSSMNSRNFTGTVVDANCTQASSLSMRYSAADTAGAKSSTSSTNSTTSTDAEKASPASTAIGKNQKSVYDLQQEVLKHCPATASTTAFAVVTDDGSFYKLDEAGNTQVTSLGGASESGKKKKNMMKNMRVTGSGTVQGDTLKIVSITKSDKPFGGS